MAFCIPPPSMDRDVDTNRDRAHLTARHAQSARPVDTSAPPRRPSQPVGPMDSHSASIHPYASAERASADAAFFAQPATEMFADRGGPRLGTGGAKEKVKVVAPAIDRSRLRLDEWDELDATAKAAHHHHKEPMAVVKDVDGCSWQIMADPMPEPGTHNYGKTNHSTQLARCSGAAVHRLRPKREVADATNGENANDDGRRDALRQTALSARAHGAIGLNGKHCQDIQEIDHVRPTALYDGYNTALPIRKRIFVTTPLSARGSTADGTTKAVAASRETAGTTWRSGTLVSARNVASGNRAVGHRRLVGTTAVHARPAAEALVCVPEAKVERMPDGGVGAHRLAASVARARVAVHHRTDESHIRQMSRGALHAGTAQRAPPVQPRAPSRADAKPLTALPRAAVVAPSQTKSAVPARVRMGSADARAARPEDASRGSAAHVSEVDGRRAAEVRLHPDAAPADARAASLGARVAQAAPRATGGDVAVPRRQDGVLLSEAALVRASEPTVRSSRYRTSEVRLASDAAAGHRSVTVSGMPAPRADPGPDLQYTGDDVAVAVSDHNVHSGYDAMPFVADPDVGDRDTGVAGTPFHTDDRVTAVPMRTEVHLPTQDRIQADRCASGAAGLDDAPPTHDAAVRCEGTDAHDVEPHSTTLFSAATTTAAPLDAEVAVSASELVVAGADDLGGAVASGADASGNSATASAPTFRQTRARVLASGAQAKSLAAGTTTAQSAPRRSARFLFRTTRSDTETASRQSSSNHQVGVASAPTNPEVQARPQTDLEDLERKRPLLNPHDTKPDGRLVADVQSSARRGARYNDHGTNARVHATAVVGSAQTVVPSSRSGPRRGVDAATFSSDATHTTTATVVRFAPLPRANDFDEPDGV
jgi:hypothetical protein